MYCLEDYDYQLPPSLIAQVPSSKREASRLMVLDRWRNSIKHQQFEDLPEYLRAEDVLVLNDTRVVPARLLGSKETGGKVEILVMDPYKDPDTGYREGYQCLMKVSKPPRPGSVILFESGFRGEILGPVRDGKTWIRFLNPGVPLLSILEQIGEVPLPPYIQRQNEQVPCSGKNSNQLVNDRNLYQTVYASKPGAVAAPTAGLHFSKELLRKLTSRGIELFWVTLHVGYGTFAPIRVRDIRDHSMHPEYAEIPCETAEHIERARQEGRRIVAVGTTVVRILEWMAHEFGTVIPFSGFCNHYIYPGYHFHVVKAMITNFHLPRSTLLLLVSAFAGRESILKAYHEAIQEGYRFYSYGDAMLIL
jgi:S-adenosylmethionine:tRNA ribosyltransferase-isomerase